MSIDFISIHLDKVNQKNMPQLYKPKSNEEIILSYIISSNSFITFEEPFYKTWEEMFCETEEEFFDTVAKYQLIRLITS